MSKLEFKVSEDQPLKDLAKEVVENSEQLKPIELPKDDIEDVQKDFNVNVTFKSSVTSVCVCARCIRCPSK